MIIGTSHCKPGETHQGWYDFTPDEVVFATFFIIREATYEEWLAYRASVGRPYPCTEDEARDYHFYEVSTD